MLDEAVEGVEKLDAPPNRLPVCVLKPDDVVVGELKNDVLDRALTAPKMLVVDVVVGVPKTEVEAVVALNAGAAV